MFPLRHILKYSHTFYIRLFLAFHICFEFKFHRQICKRQHLKQQNVLLAGGQKQIKCNHNFLNINLGPLMHVMFPAAFLLLFSVCYQLKANRFTLNCSCSVNVLDSYELCTPQFEFYEYGHLRRWTIILSSQLAYHLS